MTRQNLLKKIKQRRAELGITIENLAYLSELGIKTITRLFSGHDVKLSTVEKITKVLGLDLAGNEVVNIQVLREKRAEEKALQIVSLVQGTMALEKQGLKKENINELLEETKQQFLNGEYKRNLWEK